MKLFLNILIGLNSVLLILSGCVLSALVVNPYNPMQTAFVTEITITNTTDETLHITPIGTIGSEGRRSPLPIFTSVSPAYEAEQRADFEVKPGETKTILYDWDDINLSEIVVKNPLGQLAQLVTDPQPTARQYHQPDPSDFTISDFGELIALPNHVRSAYERAQKPFGYSTRLLWLAVPWVTFVLLLVAKRKACAKPIDAKPRAA